MTLMAGVTCSGWRQPPPPFRGCRFRPRVPRLPSMDTRRIRLPLMDLAALALGFTSPHFADDLASMGHIAELWFFGVASGAVDLVSQSMAWPATGIVYTLQYLAVFALGDALTPTLFRRRGPR